MARSTLHPVLRIAIVSAFVLATAAALAAQQPSKGGRAAPTAAAAVPDPAALLTRLFWRAVGPTNNAGRIAEIVGVPGDPLTYYVAGANGGIIRTTNGGNTFTSIFDKTGAGSIGAMAIAPSDKNIIYVGTGEGNPRNNASVGDGMYKSIDGGDHWTHIGLEKSDKVARLIVDSKDPDIVYACVLGREWGANEERGVYKTTDGGANWKKILYVDPQTACSDISADPTNSNIIYAGMYTYRRWAWHLESGAGNTAVWKSVNGGASWERLSGPDRFLGLPRKAMDRIGIAVAPSDPDIVYVISETKDEGQLWRTDDAGKSWRTVSSDRNISFRPFYYSDIRVDPKNPNRVFALSGGLYLSEDGGQNFRTVARDVHGDHQAMWIDPVDPRYLLNGNDGGWALSRDAGRNWEIVNTFPFTQFYHVNYDMQVPYRVCGGLQDNGTWCGPSNSLSGQGIRQADWYTIAGGDGFFGVPVMDKPWLVYSDAQGGMLNITDTRSGVQKTIYPYPNRVGSVGDAMIGHKYRFNWNSPIALSRQNPAVVYFGGNVLFKSTNYGLKWDVISPDLTTNDPKKQQSSGGEIVTDNTAAEFHSTLLSIAPSPLDSNVIWTSSDDGMVHVTRDGGKTWTSTFANVAGLQPNAWLATIEASNWDVGTAYVTADHHQDDDYAPYVYMTTDFGKTWKSIRGNLPDKAWWAHVIREDPRIRNLLYVGTEAGIWASWDRGAHWVSLRGDLPVTPVRDLQIHPRDNDLILATHGRGLYIMDDITPIQRIGEAGAQAQEAELFDVRPAVRWNQWSKDGNLGQRKWAGDNPPNGAIISYFLKAQPAGEVNIEIADASGLVVRRFNRVMDEPGVSRITWDGRYEAAGGGFDGRSGGGGAAAGQAQDTSLAALRARRRAATAADAGPGGGGGGFFGGGGGVAALPGTYQVSLVVGGKKYTKPVTLQNDPRVEMTPAQVTAQYETGLQLQALGQRVTRLIAGVDDIVTQLSNTQATLRRNARDNGAVLAEIEGTIKDLRHFRDSVLARPLAGLGYRQYPRLREEVQTVSGMVTRPQWPVTEGEKLRSGELRVETDEAQVRLDGIIANRVGKINEMLKGTQHVITPVQRVQP